jgi:two-component system cell cycle response regulator DivK
MTTVLIAEDNEASRDALSRRLQRHGYLTVLAVDGHEAVSMAHGTMPDLILMDLGMPNVDGWAATKQLKSDDATRHIPIIVLSAHAMNSDRALALAAGGDDFDTKPVRFAQLLEKIQRLLPKGAGQ